MTKHFKFYLAIGLFLLFGKAFSKELIIDAKFFVRNPHPTLVMKGLPSVSFEINYSVIKEILNRDYEHLKITDFPMVGSDAVDLFLEPAYIPFDQNTEWYRGTRNGLIRTKAPNLLTLGGKIIGDEHSFVFLVLTDFGLLGTIQKSNGENYTISPASNFKTGEHLLSISNEQILNSENIFECLTIDYSGSSNEAQDLLKYKDEPLYSSNLLEVKLACEGTSDFFSIFNDATKANAYIASVIAQSSKIYENFFNVRLYIGYVVVWEDSWEDPYTGTQDLSEKLQRMPNLWRGKSVDRALTVLFANLANQPANSYVAGISYGGTPFVGSLCNKDWGYCVLGIRGNAKYPTLNYTWDVNVATHEIGHNFSLPHTHNCYWLPNMIDTCVTGKTAGVGDACLKNADPIPRPGTIMSYCHLTNSTRSVQLIFHPREIPLARRAAQSSSCVKPVNQPYVSLLNPLGDATYISGTKLAIRWTSAKVNYLTIYYSIDAGENWNLIADNVPAPDSVYVWTLPDVNTTQALILIKDKGNSSVVDTSMKPFSIFRRSISVLSPLDYEFAQGETIEIYWKAVLVDTFLVEFSSDGGKTFQTLLNAFKGNSIQWTAPNIESDSCLVQVKSIDGEIVAKSMTFKIGQPYAEILFPTSGTRLCRNNYYNVRWNSKYIYRLVLEYSTDGGSSWRKISLAPVNAKSSQFLWRTPNVSSENCLVRIKSTLSDTPLAQLTTPFVLDSCTIIGSVEPIQNENDYFSVENLYFDLDNNTLNFNLNLRKLLRTINVELIDLFGRVLYSQGFSADGFVKMPFSIPINEFAQGMVFLNIKSRGSSISIPFRLIK
ncbi:MAG: M12 family metallo-peptidase [Candidatus Kapaibacteriales bacterium]